MWHQVVKIMSFPPKAVLLNCTRIDWTMRTFQFDINEVVYEKATKCFAFPCDLNEAHEESAQLSLLQKFSILVRSLLKPPIFRIIIKMNDERGSSIAKNHSSCVKSNQ